MAAVVHEQGRVGKATAGAVILKQQQGSGTKQLMAAVAAARTACGAVGQHGAADGAAARWEL